MKKHATTEFTDNGINYVVYHKTAVVKYTTELDKISKYNSNGINYVVLNSGGWEAKTTKDRMNATAYENNLPYRVYQKDYTWYIALDNYHGSEAGKCYPFEDNMQLIEKIGLSVVLDNCSGEYDVLDSNNKPIKADEKETKRYYKNIVTQNEGV